jgi:hypothetical protein
MNRLSSASEQSGAVHEDHFAGDCKDPVAVLEANRGAIEQLARLKHLHGEPEPDGSVLVRAQDLILD